MYKAFSLFIHMFFLCQFFGCVQDNSKNLGNPVGGIPAVVNRVLANNFSAPSFASKTNSTITLSYTSLDGDLASSCSVFSLSHISTVSACACVSGVCSVQVTGVIGYTGPASFLFNVEAGGKTSTTGTASFSITAAAPGSNINPTISTPTNKTTTEGIAITGIGFTIGAVDSVISCANVVGTSSNTALISNANITITGSYPNCNLSVSPTAATTGSSTITLTLTDNGDPLPALTATSSFLVTVNAFNDPPTISSVAAQFTLEDIATAAISFTIGDIDSVVSCGNVTATSSNTSLVANGSLVIGGVAPNCTITASPNLNASGLANITLSLTDNGLPLPAKTASSVFVLSVAPANDTPTISSILAQSTNESTLKSVPFTIADIDSTPSCSNVVGTSSNTTILPNGNISITGTAPNCLVNMTPAAGQTGSLTVTLVFTDNGTPMPAASASRSFTLGVDPTNDLPVISSVTSQSTLEDTASTPINFTISDSDSVITCSNVVGTSSNIALVPNSNIVISGTAPNCTAVITPLPNQAGTASITLTLTDNGTPLPGAIATSVFNFFVNPVNDAPSIAAIATQSTDEDTPSNPIAFTVTEIDSNITCAANVTATSSNTSLVPNLNLVIGGVFPNCTIVATPVANLSGSTNITLTVTDNGTPLPVLNNTRAFTLNVLPVPDLTGSLTIANNLSGIASSYTGNSYGRILKFTGLISDEALSDVEVCLGTAAGSCDTSLWAQGVGYTTGGVAPTITLGGQYRMISGVGGAQVFNLVKTCGAATNYFYSVRAINSIGKISNVVSTPAWSFWEPTCLGVGVLSQWLDASETSTITLATGVSNWTDKSGNARTVTQATAAKQPAYSSTALGGTLPGLTFNGTSSSLMRASFVYAQGSASIFAVMRAAPNVGRYLFSEGRTVTTNNYYAPMLSSGTNTLTGWIVNDAGVNELNQPTISSLYQNSTTRFVMAQDAGNSYTTYSNGTVQVQAATAYTRATNTIDTYRIGARIRAGVEAT